MFWHITTNRTIHKSHSLGNKSHNILCTFAPFDFHTETKQIFFLIIKTISKKDFLK